MKYYTLNNFAAYGGCNYGESNFGDNASCSTTTTTTGGGGGTSGGGTGGVLTNTGFEIILAVIVAGLILVAAAVVRVLRKPAAETVTAGAGNSETQSTKE